MIGRIPSDMKYIRILAMLLTVMMVLSPVGGVLAETAASEPPATEIPAAEAPATQAPETETPVMQASETQTPAAEVSATEAPVTEAPATQAPATEVPVTQAPATQVPVTQAPATPTVKPTSVPTARPVYPRIVFSMDGVVSDLSRVTQGGYLLMALPIGYEAASGQVIWSNAVNQSGWTPEAEAHPGYFRQEITQYLTEAKWRVRAEGFSLDSVFDFSGSSRNIFAYAPRENDWNMAEDAPFSMGYAVFNMPIREQIGRVKDVPGVDAAKRCAELEEQLRAEIEAMIEKEAQ